MGRTGFTIKTFAIALVLFGAQAHPQSKAAHTHSSDIGFSYTLPAAWEVVNAQQVPAPEKKEEERKAPTPDEKKGVACIQVALTARHGDPASSIVAVALPFACYGQTITAEDLPGFGDGAAEGLKVAFDITGSAESTYTLGSNNVWIERATGTAKGQLERLSSTVETVCTLLQKGAVCWMVVADNDEALQTFEHSAVSLDGVSFAALVPPEAAAKVANLVAPGH